MNISSNEKIIILPLAEYEELKEQNKRLTESLKNDFTEFEGFRNYKSCYISWRVKKSLTLNEALTKQTNIIKELLEEIENNREYISKTPLKNSFDTNFILLEKLNKIPKWVQNIFI
jgi:hypothetical protein